MIDVSRETRQETGKYRRHQSRGLHTRRGSPARIRWSIYGPVTRIQYERALVREYLEKKEEK